MTVTCAIHEGKVLVCPTCLAIERGRRGGLNKSGFSERAKKAVKQPKGKYTIADCLQTFAKSPHKSFHTKELVEATSEVKRAEAKRLIYKRLQYLYKKGKIQRIADGEYRYIFPE